MSYSLKLLHDGEDASEQERRSAEQRYRNALEDALGDATLVAPVYTAYLKICSVHGEAPAPEALTDAELEVFAQWQAAEAAALTAALGPHRYMNDAQFEIDLNP